MLTYAQAEAVLAALSNASLTQSRAFRARLKHLKKLGIPLGVAPGRGKKILYGKNEIFQWAFCLELLQFGMDPSVVASQVREHWPRFFDWMQKAERQRRNRQNDLFIYFFPEFLTAASAEERLGVDALRSLKMVNRRGLTGAVSNPHYERAGVINISQTVRNILNLARNQTGRDIGWYPEQSTERD